MKTCLHILFFVAAFAASAAHAQMYKCVDERGKTNYSDKPQPGCKKEKAIAPNPGPQAPAQMRPGGKEAAARDDDCRRVRAEYNSLNRGVHDEERENRLAQVRSQMRACM